MGLPIDELPEDDFQESYEPGASGDEEAGDELDQNEDWSRHPGVQHIQSSMQRAHNEEMRKVQDQLSALQSQLENTTMSAEQYRRRYEAVSEAVKTLGSEEQAVFIEQMAELEDLREFKKRSTEREQQRQQMTQAQQAAAQWKSNKEMQIAAMGLDPYDTRIQTAITQTLATGDDGHVLRAIGEVMRNKSAGQNSPDGEETPRQRPQPGQRPPSGGVAPSRNTQDKLRAAYQKEVAAAQGNVSRLFQLKRKYRGLGLDGI